MEKTTITLLSFWIVLSFIAPTASEAQDISIKLKVITDQANIRQKPDLGSMLILQVPQGTILESKGKKGEWYLVTVKTEEGKLVSGYVHESLVMRIQPITKKVVSEKEKEEREEKPVIQTPPVIPIPKKPLKINFAFSFSGGGNYISGEDLNKGARGFAQFHTDELGIEGEVDVKPVHLSYIVGGEVSISLAPQSLLGIGIDYFLVKKESLMVYQANDIKVTLSTKPKLQVVPLRIVLSNYLLPFLFFKCGIEYYFVKFSYFNHFEAGASWEEKSGQARSQGFGIIGALGSELKLASNLTFIIEATGRYARINGFRGTGTRMNSQGVDSTEEGWLYLYHKQNVNQNLYPQVEIREKIPAEGGEFDPRREALLDLSGISLKMGFKIQF